METLAFLLPLLYAFVGYWPLLMMLVWVIGGLIFFRMHETGPRRAEAPPPLGPMPRVTILVPCYNEEDNAEETIRSCAAQAYPDFEIITVNDGSRDRTAAVLDRLATEIPRLRVVHEDARTFCNRNTERYDLVFVDVFGSCYTIPFQAGTEEAAAAMRRAVKENGALVMNVIASLDGGAGRLFRSIHAGLARHFAEVLVFAVTDPADPETIQNLMLVALPIPRPDLAQALAGSDDPALAPLLAARVTAPGPSAPPLRDDFAPVERYSLALLPR